MSQECVASRRTALRSWDKGIPLLALGGDPDYQAVALKELAAPKDADGKIEVADAWWDLSEKKEESKETQILLRVRAGDWYQGSVSGLAGLSKKRVEKRLVTAGSKKTINFFNTATRQPLGTLRGHTDTIVAIAFSPDGKRLVSGSKDGTAKVWDVGAARGLLNLARHGRVHDVAYNPTGELIGTCGDNRVIIWDANKGERKQVYTQDDKVGSIAFAPPVVE